MGQFPKELDRAWRKRAKELGRELTAEEGDLLSGQLFEAWVDQGRFDELIRRVHHEYDMEGGDHEIVVLGYALRQRRDVERIHALFRGLVKRRLKVFWESWPEAEKGRIGSMVLCAKRCSGAMDVYLEYFHSLWAVDLPDEAEAIRQEMLQLQSRIRLKGQ